MLVRTVEPPKPRFRPAQVWADSQATSSMDLSLFDHFETAPVASSSAATSKRPSSSATQPAKKAKYDESGIEERLAGTVIEKVRFNAMYVGTGRSFDLVFIYSQFSAVPEDYAAATSKSTHCTVDL